MSPPSKRVRTTERFRRDVVRGIGAPSQDDSPNARGSAISSSQPATRSRPFSGTPALTTLCARVFASSLWKMYDETRPLREVHLAWLKLLPDSIVNNILVMLVDEAPTLLTPPLLSHYFLRGQSIALSSEVTQVTRHTITALGRVGSTLRHLKLNDFEKFRDNDFASVLTHLTGLQSLNLRGCSKVGGATVEVVAKTCHDLVKVDFSQTSVTPVGIDQILIRCQKLETIKLANMSHWTDAQFAKLLAGLEKQYGENFTLPQLHAINLSQTALSDTSVQPLIRACPSLRRLGLSFTRVKRPRQSNLTPPLEKLTLTSTTVSGPDLVAILQQLPNLRALHLGAMGGGSATSVRIDNSSAMTMTESLLYQLTDVMEEMTFLENLVLAGNTKLGMTGKAGKGALADFVTRVGRRLKSLNLASIKCLRSADLAGLLSEDTSDPQPRLEILVLDNTDVGGEAIPFLSACTRLESLSLKSTKCETEELFPLIDACPRLYELDLTGCRGVPTANRRRFFELWEEQREDAD